MHDKLQTEWKVNQRIAISIISSDFLKRHFPYMQSKSLEEILGTSLELIEYIQLYLSQGEHMLLPVVCNLFV